MYRKSCSTSDDPSLLEEISTKMVDNLKGLAEDLVMAGDGRDDSMGHSAKYGAYTILCCTLSKIIHFSLIQVFPYCFRPMILPISFSLISFFKCHVKLTKLYPLYSTAQ